MNKAKDLLNIIAEVFVANNPDKIIKLVKSIERVALDDKSSFSSKLNKNGDLDIFFTNKNRRRKAAIVSKDMIARYETELIGRNLRLIK